MIKRINDGSILGGICAGIGNGTDTNAWAWRIAFLLIPFGVPIYIFLWVLLKNEDSI